MYLNQTPWSAHEPTGERCGVNAQEFTSWAEGALRKPPGHSDRALIARAFAHGDAGDFAAYRSLAAADSDLYINLDGNRQDADTGL